MTTLLQRAVNGCQMTFLDAYQVRASFFKAASALNTSVVAHCQFSMVTRQTNDILTLRLLQLYFPRTF